MFISERDLARTAELEDSGCRAVRADRVTGEAADIAGSARLR